MAEINVGEQVLKNLALAKIEAGDAKGALTMLREQAKKVPTIIPTDSYQKSCRGTLCETGSFW